MGIIKAFSGAVSGSFSDQWRDIITVEPFTETEVIKLGTFINQNNGRGSNTNLSEGVITNGSKIFVPENTLAIIFDSSGIEGIITEPGGFEYHNGEKSLLSNDIVLQKGKTNCFVYGFEGDMEGGIIKSNLQPLL